MVMEPFDTRRLRMQVSEEEEEEEMQMAEFPDDPIEGDEDAAAAEPAQEGRAPVAY